MHLQSATIRYVNTDERHSDTAVNRCSAIDVKTIGRGVMGACASNISFGGLAMAPINGRLVGVLKHASEYTKISHSFHTKKIVGGVSHSLLPESDFASKISDVSQR